jgi:hypothetical protein
MFYFRRAAMHRGFLSFHITMGNDGTQQHHERPHCVAIQAILGYYIYWQNLQSATQ